MMHVRMIMKSPHIASVFRLKRFHVSCPSEPASLLIVLFLNITIYQRGLTNIDPSPTTQA
jgi:hypothetical protein